jgi:hypothetical protein
LEEVFQAGNFRKGLPEVEHLLILLPLAGGEAAFHRRTIVASGGTVQTLPVGQAGPRDAGGTVKAARAEVDVGAADARRK